MIERVNWGDWGFDSGSPFLRGKNERNLRITFHTSSFGSASKEDADALEILRQLAPYVSEIEALDTQTSSLPYIVIDDFDYTNQNIPIRVKNPANGDVIHYAGIPLPQQWLDIANYLVDQDDAQHLNVQSMLADLLITQAHHSLRQDIFITLSEQIFAHKDRPYFQIVNPRTPSQAVKIVGLFLRSRDNYTYWATENRQFRFPRGFFHWVLARHRLPKLWRYFSACVHSEQSRKDDILYLGQSILIRCTRALEARDAIGEKFYLPQNNRTRDEIMYHFDYLTLLLAGALDAQARIAHRAYKIAQPGEWLANFRRKKDFCKSLKKNKAIELYEIVSSQYSQDVMMLLYELRNTIHGAALPSLAVGTAVGAAPETEESLVTIPPEYGDKIWQASERCGSPEKWGLVRLHGIHFEPYTFSVTLVNECFKLVNAIADATDVEMLFPSDVNVPILADGPPEDHDMFSEIKRKRLDILG